MPLIRCASDSSGSIINITTGDDGLYNQTVTISDGTTSISGLISSEGKCTFKGVTLVGTLTISATAESTLVSTTVSVSYYGTYDINIGRSPKTILISTGETTLYGQTATVTYDTSKTKTATISNQGTATIVLYAYTGNATVSATNGEETDEVDITITSEIDEYEVELFKKIYGVSWDGSSSPAMTRTDKATNFSNPVPQRSDGAGGWTTGSSPFDNILPWSGMQIVEDATAGTLVSIPKYYYKWTKTGSAMTLQISPEPQEGFYISPAHSDRGDGQGERDVVYIGRYHCAIDTYKSTTGVLPQRSKLRSEFRTSIRNLGSGIWQNDYAMFWTIRMLYLVEFANWNSQAMIGYGCGNGTVGNMGYTDSMTYHTGTTKTSRTTYGLGTQYRYIEGLWDNVFDWCDGIAFTSSYNKMYRHQVRIQKNPAYFSDEGGTIVGNKVSDGGLISEWSIPSETGLEWALYPSGVVSGSSTTYVCDQYFPNTGLSYEDISAMFVGGYYYVNSENYGAFYFRCARSSGYDSIVSGVGSRLMKLPNNS